MSRIRRWMRAGSIAALDQAAFAGTQFAVNIVLARLLEPVDYAVFAALYAIVVLATMAHSALVGEPLMVYGARQPEDRFGAFDKSMRLLNGVYGLLWVLLGLFGCAIAWLFDVFPGRNPAELFSLGLAVGGSCWAWYARRRAYLFSEPLKAFAVSVSYAVAALGGVAGLTFTHALSVSNVLLTLAVAGAFSYVATARTRSSPRVHVSRVEALGVWRVAVSYGRWSSGAAVANWFVSNAAYLALPAFGSLDAAANYRALMNLFLPFQHLALSLGTLAIAPLAKEIHLGRQSSIPRLVVRSLPIPVLMGVGYSAVLLIFGKQLLSALYGDRYLGVAGSLWAASILPVGWAASIGVLSVLRAADMPRSVFIGYFVTAAVVGSWLIPLSAGSGVSASLLALGGMHTAAAITAVLHTSFRQRSGSGQ